MSDWKSRAKPVSQNSDWKERAKVVQSDFPVVDESSPEVGLKQRMVAKNLAQSITKQAEYLKLQYPNLDIKVQGSNVLIKRPEDGSYKVLDSSALELADIGDIGDVVGGGLASTAGTVAGAFVGNVPGAIAGSAAAGAGFEAGRQKLGQYMGVPQEVDGTDVAISAGANAIGTTLLGTGLKEGAKGAYKGAIREGWNKGIPNVASYWYGAPKEVISDYVTNRQAVEQAIPHRSDLAQSVVDRIKTALNGEKRKVGEALGTSIKGADKAVSIQPVIQQYDEYIKRLEAEFMEMPNAINKAKLDEAKSQAAQLFGDFTNEGAKVSGNLSPSAAFRLQGDLKDFGDLKRISSGVNPRFSSAATQSEKDLSNQALSGYQHINKELDRVTEGASPELKRQYQELMQMQGALSSGTNTPQQAYSTLTSIGGKSKTAFREQLEKLAGKTGERFDDDITRLQSAEYFGDAGWVPKSINGTTSTSRTVPAAGLGAFIGYKVGSSAGGIGMGGLGAAAGAAAGNASASPKALKALINYSDALRSGANAVGKVYAPMTPVVRETIVQSPWDGM